MDSEYKMKLTHWEQEVVEKAEKDSKKIKDGNKKKLWKKRTS